MTQAGQGKTEKIVSLVVNFIDKIPPSISCKYTIENGEFSKNMWSYDYGQSVSCEFEEHESGFSRDIYGAGGFGDYSVRVRGWWKDKDYVLGDDYRPISREDCESYHVDDRVVQWIYNHPDDSGLWRRASFTSEAGALDVVSPVDLAGNIGKATEYIWVTAKKEIELLGGSFYWCSYKSFDSENSRIDYEERGERAYSTDEVIGTRNAERQWKSRVTRYDETWSAVWE